MKSVLFLFVFFCVSNCVAQKPMFDKVIVEYVNLDMETFSDVSCGKFYDYFGTHIDRKKFCNIDSITNIYRTIIEFKQRGEKFKRQPDVRIKVKFFYKGKITFSICSGSGMTTINNVNYINDKAFRKYLRWLSNSPEYIPR